MTYFKVVWLTGLFVVSVFGPAVTLGQQVAPPPPVSVRLAWSASPDSSVTGYNIYYRDISTALTNKLNVGTALTVTVPSLQSGATYSFYATAYNASQVESQPSNLISYTPIAKQPDLILTSVGFSPTAPVQGNPVLFSATILNQGTGPTPQGTNMQVNFAVDSGSAVGWCILTNALPPGASVNVTAQTGPSGIATWTAVPGVHSVTATVNALSSESNGTNNQLKASIAVASLTSPVVSLALNKTNVAEMDSVGANLTIQRSGSTSAPLAVNLRFGGSARSGLDYSPVASLVVIPTGSNSVSIALKPIHNSLLDGVKTVDVSLVPDSSYQVGTSSALTLLIVNQDIDSDGDGMSDAAELLAGTNANDRDSNLRINSIQSEPGGQLTLRWTSVPGITYRVLAKSSFASSDWNLISPAITSVGSTTSWTFTATNALGLYGLSLQPAGGL